MVSLVHGFVNTLSFVEIAHSNPPLDYVVQVGTFAERFAFLVEWLDGNSGITWKYQLLYFPETREVEMVRS